MRDSTLPTAPAGWRRTDARTLVREPIPWNSARALRARAGVPEPDDAWAPLAAIAATDPILARFLDGDR